MTTNLFDDNQHLYNSFKSYNTAYSNYVKCVENTYNSNNTPPYDSSYNNLNGTIKFSSTACTTEANNLNSAYTDFIAQISKVKTTATKIQGDLTSIDDIKKNQNNNQILRSELDMKLQDLYSIQDSLPVMNQTNVDSTTFAFVLWTVLASSMLLYVFTGSSSNTST
jgi:phosphoserine aminotransferase